MEYDTNLYRTYKEFVEEARAFSRGNGTVESPERGSFFYRPTYPEEKARLLIMLGETPSDDPVKRHKQFGLRCDMASQYVSAYENQQIQHKIDSQKEDPLFP